MSRKPVNVFVSSRGNAFMTDIARWIVEAAQQAGRTAALVCDRLPSASGAINLVVAPHELFVLDDASDAEIARAAAASVPICTEQPGTPWFNLTAGLIRDAPIVIDINPRGVDAIRARGHEAMHLQLGGVPSMRAPDGRPRPRPAVPRGIDAAPGGDAGLARRRCCGTASVRTATVPVQRARSTAPRRARCSATTSTTCWRAAGSCSTSTATTSAPGYFEWARMVEAMANGCAVLTEPSTGFEPLDRGQALRRRRRPRRLRSPSCSTIRSAAARSARRPARQCSTNTRSSTSLAPILDRLDDIAPGRPRRHRKPPPRTHRPPLFGELRPADRAAPPRVRGADGGAAAAAPHRPHALHRAARDRRLRRTRSRRPSYAGADPSVSVIVTLYNYADVVTETLDSIVASTGVDLEIVVVDDHSRDDGPAVVRRFMDEHPDVPMLLLASDVNRGLPASRNLAVAAARADRIMVMDADNTVYPNCLRRLSDALDADPTAAFAYATLEAFGAQPGSAQRARMVAALVVRVELHRRPGDGAARDVRPPRRLPRGRRLRLRLGGLGALAAARRGR